MLKVVAFMKQVAEELRMGGNFGTAHVYRSSINAIIAYHGEGDFSFDEVTPESVSYTHLQQDFKFEISDARKIAKTLSAFANTDGGRLLIGVKDNGRIAGVRSEEEKYMIEAAAQLYCIPEIDYTLQTLSLIHI